MARAVLLGVPHHLTQRGLNRRDIFFDESDYQVYLAQVRQMRRGSVRRCSATAA
jgi:hypothetical protein